MMSLLLASVYLPFFISEMLQLSGIITILFTGMSARKYTNKNISAAVKLLVSLLMNWMLKRFIGA